MKQLIFVCFAIISPSLLYAQAHKEGLKLSAQTDLLAYTTPNGWSIWGVAQLNQNKLSLAFVNYPNRRRDTYNQTNIKEHDRFVRLQLVRYFKPTSWFKNFFYGVNIEHHWRKLEEDNNPDEVLRDTHWKLGPILGYEWHPWRKKEHALRNLSVVLWAGANFRPNYTKQVRVFENTGNVYGISPVIEASLGINISYTLYQNSK